MYSQFVKSSVASGIVEYHASAVCIKRIYNVRTKQIKFFSIHAMPGLVMATAQTTYSNQEQHRMTVFSTAQIDAATSFVGDKSLGTSRSNSFFSMLHRANSKWRTTPPPVAYSARSAQIFCGNPS